ncbi:major facilitator superfamily domain-containing protein [Dactylonectria macrodidyma]|uniref:Major facilitator superfamily domain-containing protein n=1 Tax=Dactylonectria macrodidyma TaxID=307937 RepID=A0A9P9FM01_9HYPO|nr:major facilitator superfamily domain-containing protein [Dactylonectria macrodidyma]
MPPTAADIETGTAIETVESVPGTRLLVDWQHKLEAAAHGTQDIVLLPAPTNHPDDPLNWSPLRKYASYFIVCFYSFMVAVVSLSTAVTYGALIVEFNTTAEYLNVGTAVSILLIGMGNMFWNPLALKYGRRPVYTMSSLLTMVTQILAATAQSSQVFVGSRILMGFVAAPFEQLPAVTANDQFFIHHRGFALSLYVLAATLGSFLGPIATGFIVDGVGWRWVYWVFTIAMALTTLMAFFGLEETYFDRENMGTRGEGSQLTTPPPTSKSYGARLKLATSFDLGDGMFNIIVDPVKLLVEPIIIWSACLYGFGISWLAVMAFTANTVFQSPEYGYNFSFTAVGLTSIAPLIGSLLTFYAGGAGTDRLMVWQARRNKGVMEPESRIYVVFLAAPIMAGGLVLYGAGASAGLPWIAPVIGMGMIGAGIPIAGEVSLGYVTESYTSKAGVATTAMITLRNVIACAMIFAAEPWIEHNGLRDAFIIMGVLCFVVFMSGALFIWKGKACRRRSARIWGLS